MTTIFEFLDVEPIENVVTCLHYKADKVIFMGYQEIIDEVGESTEDFLKSVCDVRTVLFVPLSHEKLDSTLKNIGRVIEQEKSEKNDLFFDITGGEELSLVAFGMLADRYKVPIHFYEIKMDRLVVLSNDAPYSIRDRGEERVIKLTLDRFIRMSGGVINENLNKAYKKQLSASELDDVKSLWQVAGKHADKWNVFSNILKRLVAGSDELCVSGSYNEILDIFKEDAYKKLNTPKAFNLILDELSDTGLVSEVKHSDGKYRFKFKNQRVKECLLDGGSILELYVYSQEVDQADDCRVGVHLDWDGVIEGGYGKDVYNEIDVLSIKDNIPTFISCKSGKLSGPETLQALYELNTVTERFGGKYARKKLTITQQVPNVYLERAAEMGIEIEMENVL